MTQFIAQHFPAPAVMIAATRRCAEPRNHHEEPIRMTTRRQFVQMSAGALATPLLSKRAFAQAWPSRPIRAMIPFAPGSSLDIVGRLVCDPLSAQLGQPVVVENRGGAGGTIGTGLVAKAD